MDLLIFLLIGAFSGWLAGTIMEGEGYGLLADIILGIVGGIVGRSVLAYAGVAIGGLIGQIAACVLGAVLIIAVVRLIKRA